MYFVPLVSPTPMNAERSKVNTQEVYLHAPVIEIGRDRFVVTCGIEIHGEGRLRHVVDHRVNLEKNAARLREGAVLERQLDEITIEGAGRGDIRVEGMISNQTPRVLEVELRFSGHGKPSPVTIGLVDLSEANGALQRRNEQVARVQSLAFRASTSSVPRMHVHVGSVMDKDAGGGWWQRMGGAVTGFAANLFLKPIRVDAVGHATMLRLGANLAAGRDHFTFPSARPAPSPGPAPAPAPASGK